MDRQSTRHVQRTIHGQRVSFKPGVTMVEPILSRIVLGRIEEHREYSAGTKLDKAA